MLSLRVLRVNGADQSLQQTLRRHRPWIWGALFALVASGIVLLISEPVRNMINPIFWIKMALLTVAVAASLWFQRSVRLKSAEWEISPGGHALLRFSSVAIVILWCAVMAGGRWIAYAPV